VANQSNRIEALSDVPSNANGVASSSPGFNAQRCTLEKRPIRKHNPERVESLRDWDRLMQLFQSCECRYH
jgi:hypothetical protein